MRGVKDKKLVVGFLLFCLVCSLNPCVFSETFFGTPVTGFLELPDARYPVFLFVPDSYTPDREYPLIISIPDEGESPKEHLEAWKSLAKRTSMIVLVPTNLWPKDVPYAMDEWVLDLKKDILRRYRIGNDKIYLLGRKAGAHYASYLAVKYPGEFSAVGLLGNAWVGRFEKLVRPQSRPVKQLPIFIALRESDIDLIAKIEKKAVSFEKKGYAMYLAKVKSEDEYLSDEFKKRLIAWLQEHAETWKRVKEKSQKSWKEKTLNWMEKFFIVS